MPDAITEFAPAKINLALHVLGRRADGLHELDSIVAFADVGDRLTLERSDTFDIVATGPVAADVPAPPDHIHHHAVNALAGEPPAVLHLQHPLPGAAGIA